MMANELDLTGICFVFDMMPTLKTSEQLNPLFPWNVALDNMAVPSELVA